MSFVLLNVFFYFLGWLQSPEDILQVIARLVDADMVWLRSRTVPRRSVGDSETR